MAAVLLFQWGAKESLAIKDHSCTFSAEMRCHWCFKSIAYKFYALVLCTFASTTTPHGQHHMSINCIGEACTYEYQTLQGLTCFYVPYPVQILYQKTWEILSWNPTLIESFKLLNNPFKLLVVLSSPMQCLLVIFSHMTLVFYMIGWSLL